jgi:hypothetical protein
MVKHRISIFILVFVKTKKCLNLVFIKAILQLWNIYMKHPCLFKNTQGNDYSEQMHKVQMPKNVDVPSDLVKIK